MSTEDDDRAVDEQAAPRSKPITMGGYDYRPVSEWTDEEWAAAEKEAQRFPKRNLWPK